MVLSGRTALITGGAQGIGYATAKAFVREGATVVINDLNGEAAQKAAAELGPGHASVAGDVGDENDVQRFVSEAEAHLGHIDILVNNAGMGDTFVPTVDQPLTHWQKLIDTHLTGTYLVSQAVAPGMIARKSGVILNLNSIAGVLGLPVRTAYSAAKAGVGMLTRVLGCEWAPHGIRVNAVAPGYIRTPLTNQLIEDGKIDAGRIMRRTPMGQLGSPEDIAAAMVFLASDNARFVTAVTLPVDGGYCAWGAPSDAHPGPEEPE